MSNSIHAQPVLREITAAQTLSLRQAVLWPDKPLSQLQVPGDDSALHIGAFYGEDLVGVGSFFASRDGVQLRKLAVLPAQRGGGLGVRIVLHGAHRARADGARVLWCDARETAIGFYQKIGFAIDPKRFQKSGLWYHVARLNLAGL